MSLFSLTKLYDFERYFLHKISKKKAFRKHDKAPFTFNCPNQCSYSKNIVKNVLIRLIFIVMY